MVYGYIRVSTEEQNLENQKKAIREKFTVDKWVEEKRSGTVDYKKRNLGGLIDELQPGDVLVMTELSRLGRSLSMIFNVISALQEQFITITEPIIRHHISIKRFVRVFVFPFKI